MSGLYDRVFVPASPGNTGLAIGCAYAAADEAFPLQVSEPLSPFLGPSFSNTQIKATLDNCKLSGAFHEEGELVDQTVKMLARGELVGWFHGRMEWGRRALGNRSILANPMAPFVLENLNAFLKQRPTYVTFGVSICEEDLADYFTGPASSRFMEHEYTPKDPQLFAKMLPLEPARLRVHTVGASPALLRRLLKAFGEATGKPILINTSFNGFHEPIVCTPRDAVRVFYGTGLDALVIGNFILRK
jgi:carbamoyltransferase